MIPYKSYVVVYFTKDKKNCQLIKPNITFCGAWKELVETICPKGHHSYEVVDY